MRLARRVKAVSAGRLHTCQRQCRRCQHFFRVETAKFVKRVVPPPATRDRLGPCFMFQESAFSRYARRHRDLFLGGHRCLSVQPMLLQSIGHEWGKSCAAEVSVWGGEQSGLTVLPIRPSGTKLPALPLDGRLDSSQQASRAEPESTPASSLTKSRRGITQNGLSDGAKRGSSRLR
jgi:hypothetical protein